LSLVYGWNKSGDLTDCDLSPDFHPIMDRVLG
jgi:hypothetical protein